MTASRLQNCQDVSCDYNIILALEGDFVNIL